MGDSGEYWVFDWLDRHRVMSVEQAELLLANPVAVGDLKTAAQQALRQFGHPVSEGDSVLAGRGIDLSGQLDCSHPSCRKKQVDRLFSRVWHYFDKIVVEDSIAHEVAMHWDEADAKKRNEWILSHIRVLLYVKQIGAESLLDFRLKPPPCQVHVLRHIEEASLTRVLEVETALVRAILRSAEITLRPKGAGDVDYRLDYSEFEHTQWGVIPRSQARGLREGQLKALVVKQVLEKFLSYLASDVRSAHLYKAPLGAVIPIHQTLLHAATSPTIADVALQLQLPVLEGLPPEILIRIRKDENEHFSRFKTKLRLAMQERLRVKDTDAAKIAKDIRRDIIEPELALIRDRLTATEKTVVKKSTVGIFLGALWTTCGILAGAPPPLAVTTGIGAAVSIVGTGTSKYLDDKRDIVLSDMYFAWKAEQHARHRR